MEELRSLLGDNEKIYSYGLTSSYSAYHFIAENDSDISASLEDTLKRLLNADLDPYYYMGAFIPTSEEMDELSEYNEYMDIDLGYVLGGLITSVWEGDEEW